MATANGAAAGKGQYNKIGRFYEGAIREEVMRDFVRKNVKGLDVTGLSKAEIGVAITNHFDTTIESADDKAECEECGGEGPDDAAACPFCGFEGDLAEDDAAEPAKAAAAGEDGDEEASEAEDAAVQAAAPVPEKKSKAKKSKADKAADKESKMAKNGTTATAAKTVETPAVEVVREGSNLVHLKGRAPSKVLGAADLDADVVEVQRLKADTSKSFLALGRKIGEIHKSQSWKLRKATDGSARWKSFEAFTNEELQMVPAIAYDLMKLADKFTEEDVVRLGRSKLTLILKAPLDRQDSLKAEVEAKGLTKKQLAERVAEEKKTSTTHKPSKKSLAGTAGAKKVNAAKKALEPKKEDKITVASITGKQTVKLYAKPASMRNLDLETLKRAASVAKQPIGRLVLANDVSIWFEVKQTEAGLVLVCDTRRDS